MRLQRAITLSFRCALCKQRHFKGECSVRIKSYTIYGDPREDPR